MRSSCARCCGLIDERHAQFNGTLYQLEPDVKEAPGALRDLTATRTIALLTDPLLLRRGPADAGAFRRCGGFPPARALDAAPGMRAQPERAEPRAAGAHRRDAWIPRRRAAAARREADERLLPPRADRQPLARVGAPHRARCLSARISGSRATASASSIPCRRRAIPLHGSARSRRRSTREREVSEEALSCIQQHVDRYRADDFFAGAQDRARAAAVPQAAARTLRAALADARLRAARAGVPRVPGDLLARRARLLSQVHGRRAHAAHDPESRAARRRPTSAIGCGSGRFSPTCRSPSCSCWRCCSTTSASGATTITRSRACGWPSMCSSGCR